MHFYKEKVYDLKKKSICTHLKEKMGENRRLSPSVWHVCIVKQKKRNKKTEKQRRRRRRQCVTGVSAHLIND